MSYKLSNQHILDYHTLIFKLLNMVKCCVLGLYGHSYDYCRYPILLLLLFYCYDDMVIYKYMIMIVWWCFLGLYVYCMVMMISVFIIIIWLLTIWLFIIVWLWLYGSDDYYIWLWLHGITFILFLFNRKCFLLLFFLVIIEV